VSLRRLIPDLVGVVLLVSGVALIAYGLFAVLYNGDSGGSSTYVAISGHRVNSDLVGLIALAVGALAISGFVMLRRRARRMARTT
jgi:hypothetical protein